MSASAGSTSGPASTSGFGPRRSPGVPRRHQTNSTTAATTRDRDQEVERLEGVADVLPVGAEHGARRRRAAPTTGRPRRSSTATNGPIGIRATPAGKLMNVRTIGSSRPMNTVAAPCCCEEPSASLDLVLPDQQVLPVALEERPAAVRADGVGDQRADRVPDRREDHHDPEVPRRPVIGSIWLGSETRNRRTAGSAPTAAGSSPTRSPSRASRRCSRPRRTGCSGTG